MSTRDTPAPGALADVQPRPSIRPQWLALVEEPALEPDLPIIDPHHHFALHGAEDYGLADLAADTSSGHRIEATVYIECRAGYRPDGPLELRPVGETEGVLGMMGDAPPSPTLPHEGGGGSPPTRFCAGIVCYADLMLGTAVRPVLEAQIAAGRGRVKGIRNSTVSHADPNARGAAVNRPAGMLLDPRLREGFACLAPLGLTFDSWIYHTQVGELTDLARAYPDTVVVLDHVSGILGIGPYSGRREETFREWRRALVDFAACANARVKLGGLGMPLFGFGFHEQVRPPGSERLAAAWRPYIETAIELMGAERCMFESNFPVDKASCAYGVLWNAFKRITADCSASEKAALYSGTARRTYRL